MAENHCLALNSQGLVFSWGLAIDGALGYELLNLEACQLVPKLVKIDEAISKIVVGPQNSAFISESGQLYLCGQNYYQSCQSNTSLNTISSIHRVDSLHNDAYTDISFSNLSYNILTTQSGKTFELGYSPKHDQETLQRHFSFETELDRQDNA